MGLMPDRSPPAESPPTLEPIRCWHCGALLNKTLLAPGSITEVKCGCAQWNVVIGTVAGIVVIPLEFSVIIGRARR